MRAEATAAPVAPHAINAASAEQREDKRAHAVTVPVIVPAIGSTIPGPTSV